MKKRTLKPEAQLNPMQERFCIEYLKDFNATKAAERVGYSKKTSRQQGARLLSNAVIQAKLKKLKAEVLQKAQITLEDIVEELAFIARSRFSDVGTVSRGKLSLKNFKNVPERAMAAIQSISQNTKGKPSLKLFDKNKALEILLRYFVENPGSEPEKKIIQAPLPIRIDKGTPDAK